MRKTAIKRFHLTGRRPVCRTLKHTGCYYVELVFNVPTLGMDIKDARGSISG